ncbi:hypothetical protein ES332_A05G325300v1 [Gossypium tomentosum]|uniref:SWIRM domain-containing protein n=1 Tax=Gossypium tomentosum TaxID=34277 RepID=A0A5D2QMV6_GOSTO|nr:hypothetical protein ES332_A05G325300v1 [Gossypium tomentosum]
MNPPNETLDDFSQFPLPHFTLTPPLPNPTSIPNFHPIPILNPNAAPPLNDHLISFPTPKKRRRGRPQRSGASAYQFLTFTNGSFSPNLPNSNPNLDLNSITSSSAATEQTTQPKIDDEIIVISKESTAEALTALSAGFPADSLTEEEIDFGVISSIGGIEQVNYILIRNHIIAKWRENASNWVAKDMLVDSIPKHCSTILNSAYNYLVTYGYINFGIAPAIKEKIPAEPTRSNVVIIGTGLAGLAAARQLMREERAGGRVYTKKMEGGNRVSAAADLGGSVLTGTLGESVRDSGEQLGSSLFKVRDKCPLYRTDGSPVDPDMDMKVEMALIGLLDKASELRQLMGRELSLAFWDQDDPYDMGGDHCFLPGGNGRLVQALAENVPILYEKTVHTINYGNDGVQVMTGSQVYEGDMALCTVPLGVLKSGSIKFVPELPQRKLDGIKRLGFGLLNKVGMLFPYVFWGTDFDTFGHLTNDPSRRGDSGGPLLLALVAGEAAHRFESLPPIDVVAQVLQILKGIYEPQGITVPEPLQTVCTRWGGDPFSLGSYSNVAVGASGDDYDILAESVGDGRLFFAGEATTRRYPATMHGAFLTGLREAANMAQYAKSRTAKKKINRSPSSNAHSYACALMDLFREPDLEFGSFSVIFCQKNANPKSPAILRVTISAFQQLQSHFNQQQQLHVYTLLSKKQAFELREVRGGDEMRLNYLCEKLGIKLVGRKGLGPTADSIIASIKAQKGVRKPSSTPLAPKSGTSMLKIGTLKQKFIRKAKIARKTKGLIPPVVNAANGNLSEEIKLIKQALPDSSSSGMSEVF